METAALIASLVSIGLAIFAVSIAIIFFKMSTNLSEGIKDAAKDISSGVDKLEKIFDKLYADTFGMMKDTITDMRRHIWPEKKATEGKISEETEKKAEEKIQKLRAEIKEQLKETLDKQKITNKKYAALSKDMSNLADKIIASSRRVDSEAKKEALRSVLLNYIRDLPVNKSIKADRIVTDMRDKYTFDVIDTVKELENLRSEGIITYKEKFLAGGSDIKRIKKTDEMNF